MLPSRRCRTIAHSTLARARGDARRSHDFDKLSFNFNAQKDDAGEKGVFLKGIGVFLKGTGERSGVFGHG